jgi:hypothetical protein
MTHISFLGLMRVSPGRGISCAIAARSNSNAPFADYAGTREGEFHSAGGYPVSFASTGRNRLPIYELRLRDVARVGEAAWLSLSPYR